MEIFFKVDDKGKYPHMTRQKYILPLVFVLIILYVAIPIIDGMINLGAEMKIYKEKK